MQRLLSKVFGKNKAEVCTPFDIQKKVPEIRRVLEKRVNPNKETIDDLNARLVGPLYTIEGNTQRSIQKLINPMTTDLDKKIALDDLAVEEYKMNSVIAHVDANLTQRLEDVKFAIEYITYRTTPKLREIDESIDVECDRSVRGTLHQIVSGLKHDIQLLYTTLLQQETDLTRLLTYEANNGYNAVSPSHPTTMRAPGGYYFNGSNNAYHHSQIDKHIHFLSSMSSQPVCNTSATGSIRNQLAALSKVPVGISTYANAQQQMRCVWRGILADHENNYISKFLSDVHVMKASLAKTFQPVKLISDSSVEGVTWSIGYGGKGPYALLKYGVSKSRVSVGYEMDKELNMLHELTVGLILNELVTLTPNFMFVYGGFLCRVPLSGNPSVTKVEANYRFSDLCSDNSSRNTTTCMIVELVQNAQSFNNFVKESANPTNPNRININDVYKAYMQVVFSLAIAYEKFRFIHADLHSENVMVTKLTTPIRLVYTIGGVNYTIDNVRYVAKIIDYGFARLNYNGQRFDQCNYGQDGKGYTYSKGQAVDMLVNNNEQYPPFFDVSWFSGVVLEGALDSVSASNPVKQALQTLSQRFAYYVPNQNRWIHTLGRAVMGHEARLCDTGAPWCIRGERSFDQYWNQRLAPYFSQIAFLDGMNNTQRITTFPELCSQLYSLLRGYLQ